MYPEGGGREVTNAKLLCNGDPTLGTRPCPVRRQCLEWALTHDEKHGVWGGKSERERRTMRRDRKCES
jgi:WhiB family redox-sensing transcriptional regulator